MKTRLGISAAMLMVLTYIFGLFGGYIALAILCGYILLCETEEEVRKAAVKTLVLVIAFDVVGAVIGLIPNGFTLISNFLYIFNLSLPFYIITKIFTFISSALAILEKIVFLVLAFMAWTGKNWKIPGLDDLLEKHM